MKGNKYIKRVRVDSRQLDSGMFGTKVYITEGEVVDGIMPVCNDPAVPAQLSGFGIGLRRCFHL